MNLTQIPQNYKNNVDWILKAYSDSGISFSDGFQKDAIQNAAGAREKKGWNNWGCDISIKQNEKGTFLIVEDYGTTGLTGENKSSKEIEKLLAEGGFLEVNERLARFSSMFNSGGNTTGGGLYGAGKSVYSVASIGYIYYFDSLRNDGKYVANMNNKGRIYENAFENNKAKDFIKENTGLDEKTTTGSRIIIASPKEELINSITNNELLECIQESWWIIIEMGAHISINGKQIYIPDVKKNTIHNYELPSPEKVIKNKTVKHFGFYLFDNKEIKWSGISYYRKGMKIGEVDINDIQKELTKKATINYWGYIEVDESWEEELAEIEDNIHFGVSRGKKNSRAYQDLKNYCEDKVRELLLQWGYIKNFENENKRLNEELKKIAEGINNLFDKLGFEDLGKGPKKSDFDIRWKNVHYPLENSEKVTTGDILSFSFTIKNQYSTDKNFKYNMYLVDKENNAKISSIFENQNIHIKSKQVFQKKCEIAISQKIASQFKENRIVLKVAVPGSSKMKTKELPFFYDIDRPINQLEYVDLSLHSCTFPTPGSKRVNFDEYITNVNYRIENKRNCTLNYKLNISIHNANDINCPKIEDIKSIDGTIPPFEEIITPFIEKITFKKDLYEKFLDEGPLQLRARLIANDDDEEFEKGDKITKYHYTIYLNCNEKSGKTDSFDIKSVDAPGDYRRSYYRAGTNRTIYVNIGHKAYTSISENSNAENMYLREQVLKQYVLLYLAEGKFDMFVESNKDFSTLEPQEAAEQVINKIENIYFESLE